jgi:hypothetical protein
VSKSQRLSDAALRMIEPQVALDTWLDAQRRLRAMEASQSTDTLEVQRQRLRVLNLKALAVRCYRVNVAPPPHFLIDEAKGKGEPLGERPRHNEGEPTPPPPPVGGRRPAADPLAHLRPWRCGRCGLVVPAGEGCCGTCREHPRGSVGCRHCQADYIWAGSQAALSVWERQPQRHLAWTGPAPPPGPQLPGPRLARRYPGPDPFGGY